MHDLPKHVKRSLRELAARAHEAELHAELAKLAEHFDAWRRGEVDSFDLGQLIHEFHDGAARETWKTYNGNDLRIAVAYAIHTGVLKRDDVPPETLDALKNALAFYEDMERAEGAAESIADDLR